MSALTGSLCGASGAARQPETVQPVCKRLLGQKIPLEVRRLPPSSFETDAGLPTRGTVRAPAFFQLRSPALRPAIDQYVGLDLHLRDGCWLRIPFLEIASARPPAEITVIQPRSGSGATLGPIYTDNRPDIAGYDFVQAFPAHTAEYPWVGLWKSRARPVRSAIIAFGPRKDGVSPYAVVKMVALDLRAICSSPYPHGNSLAAFAISAPLRDGSVVALRLVWSSYEAPVDRRPSLSAA
ncbi:MAG: hypothetical protein V4574_14930 [Pseudomonadota bacterium]